MQTSFDYTFFLKWYVTFRSIDIGIGFLTLLLKHVQTHSDFYLKGENDQSPFAQICKV